MRRNSEGVFSPPPFLPEALSGASYTDIIAALEPHVGEARRERLLSVIRARLRDVTVLFDAPYDPHNGAAVIRSCDAFGVGSLHIIERQKRFLAAKSVARGSERWIELFRYQAPLDAANALKSQGFHLIGAEAWGTLAPEDLPQIPKLCLVLGNEKSGIDAALRDRLDGHVRVPMRGFVESLNVSVTSAILLHAAVRGRDATIEPDEVARLYARALYLSVEHAAAILAHKGLS